MAVTIRRVERKEAYAAIDQVYADLGFTGDYWTAERVAEAEQRMAVDDADMPDETAWMLDFAWRVLDKLRVVEPYDGPGQHHR